MLLLGKRLIQARFYADARQSAVRLAERTSYNVRRVYGTRHANTLSFSSLLSSLYIATGLHHIKNNDEAMAKVYFRKALSLHEAALKALVDDDGDDASDDEDLDSEIGSVGTGAGQNIVAQNGTADATYEQAAEIASLRTHIRLLKLAFQRLGGWAKPASDYERLTATAWKEFGAELGMEEDQVLSAKWSIKGFGGGKAESNDDDFKAPKIWTIAA